MKIYLTPKHIKTAFVLAVMSLSFNLSAQFNIKIGYNGGYSNLDKTSEIFDLYNDQFTNVDKRLNPVRFFNGLDIGGRYKFADQFAIDIGVNYMSGDNQGEGIQISPTETISNEYKISILNYYVGLESYFKKNMGLGGNIGYQRLSYKSSIDDADKVNIMSQTVLNSRFYLIFEAPSDNVSYSIRPFVSVNYEPYNIHDVNINLLPDSNRPQSDFDEDVLIFGISILFFNGPQ